jgi:hypothetical protein
MIAAVRISNPSPPSSRMYNVEHESATSSLKVARTRSTAIGTMSRRPELEPPKGKRSLPSPAASPSTKAPREQRSKASTGANPPPEQP